MSTAVVDTCTFSERVERALNEIGAERLQYQHVNEWIYETPYRVIERHAYQKELFYTAIALRAAKVIHDGMFRGNTTDSNGRIYSVPYCKHCFDVGRRLINLHVPLTKEKEDVLIASGILHDAVNVALHDARAHELKDVWHFSDEIVRNVTIAARHDFNGVVDHYYYYKLFEQHETWMTIMIRLADCSCIVDKLYQSSVGNMRDYMHRTRSFFLPMCCFAKEQYPQFIPIWNLYMDKIKTMIEATELLLDRYETREFALNTELLALRDENATIRGCMKNTMIKGAFDQENSGEA